jgi:hypothetical protein
MTIYLRNLAVPSNAPAGTVIGTLSADEGNTEIPCTFTLLNNPNDYFAISGNNLVTAQGGGMTAGQYAVQVSATPIALSVSTAFTITVADASMPPPAPPAPPPPAPPAPPPPAPLSNGVYLITSGGNAVDGGFGYWNVPPYVQLYPTNSGTGQQWSWNGSTFSNVLVATSGSMGTAGPLLVDAGDGTPTETATGDTWTVSPSGNGYTIRDNRTGNYLSIVSDTLAMSGTQTVWTITAISSPSPTAITLSPASVTIADNVPAGTRLATANVTMSDGSQFTGRLTTSNTDFFAISGLDIVTARALTQADDGAHTTVITASQGSQSLSMSFSV